MSQRDDSSGQAYWRANLRVLFICLSIWAVFGFGASILFAGPLNHIQFFGFKLGFWFAQQGAIFVFTLLIFYYTWRMNRLDREHDVHED